MRCYLRLTALLCVVALLPACTTTELASHMFKRLFGDEEPGLPSRVKVGNPYKVDGRWYTPAYQPDYKESGMASWYGPGFHGKYTANGEVYDQEDITAAHRTLPLPSIVRVTNKENGRSLIVRVNDRGPFAKDRIIDLSHRSAELLGIVGTGTANVQVEYLDKETKENWASLGLTPPSGIMSPVDATTYASSETNPIAASELLPPAPVPGSLIAENAPMPLTETPVETSTGIQVADISGLTPAAGSAVTPLVESDASQRDTGWIDTSHVDYQPPVTASGPGVLARPVVSTIPLAQAAEVHGLFVQAGAFGQQQNAEKVAIQLASFGKAEIIPVEVAAKTLYRVRVGPLQSRTEAEAVRAGMAGQGFPGARVVSD